MGYNLAAIAVRGTRDRVLGALEKSVGAHGLQMAQAPDGHHHLNAREAAGWMMLQLEVRLMPSIAVDLSRRLRTDVLCIDVHDSYSYEHASWIVQGAPKLVYTKWQAEVVERLPRDLTPVLREACARTQRRFPTRVREQLDRGVFSEVESFLLDFFNESIAPIDVLALALDAYEDPEEGQFAFVGPLDTLTMSVEGPRLWSEASGLALEGKPHRPRAERKPDGDAPAPKPARRKPPVAPPAKRKR